MNRTFYIDAGTTITTMTPSFYVDPLERFPYDPEKAAQNTEALCLVQGLAIDESCLLLEEEDELLVFSLPSVPVFMVSKEDVKIVSS